MEMADECLAAHFQNSNTTSYHKPLVLSLTAVEKVIGHEDDQLCGLGSFTKMAGPGKKPRFQSSMSMTDEEMDATNPTAGRVNVILSDLDMVKCIRTKFVESGKEEMFEGCVRDYHVPEVFHDRKADRSSKPTSDGRWTEGPEFGVPVPAIASHV